MRLTFFGHKLLPDWCRSRALNKMRINLKNRRKDLGLSQEALARQSGVERSTIAFLETGKRNGSVELWDRLEDILKAPQRWLREKELPSRKGGSSLSS
jgi:transcriptional regulator with XRE-family HTH domain